MFLYILRQRLFKKSKIAINCYIKHPGNIESGHGITILSGCMLDAPGKNRIRLGDRVKLNRSVYLGANGNNLSIGAESQINRHAFLDARGGIDVGERVLIGPYVKIISYRHVFDDVSIPIIEQGMIGERIVIEDDVWIGAGVVVLSGVIIGRGSVIGANAVVTKSCAPYSVLGGVPARLLRTRGTQKDAEQAISGGGSSPRGIVIGQQ